MSGLVKPRAEVLIAGASVRAAARSAWRSGLHVWGADQFADADLALYAAHRLPAEGNPVARILGLPPMPWMYTGGWENRPSWITAVSRRHRLCGNDARTVRRVRNPRQWTGAIQRAGLAVLPLARPPLPTECQWLEKPVHSAGGRRIRPARRTGDSGEPVYFQQFRPGVSIGATFVAAGGQSRLLGAARQLVGADWLCARPYAHAGGIAIRRLPGSWSLQLQRLGHLLAGEFGLSGLFGVDLVACDGVLYPLEINPRFPASVELWERAEGRSAVRLHLDASLHGRLPEDRPRKAPARTWGNAILYAAGNLPAGSAHSRLSRIHRLTGLLPADIPTEGQTIGAGCPVATLLAYGHSEEETERQLREGARLFYGPGQRTRSIIRASCG